MERGRRMELTLLLSWNIPNPLRLPWRKINHQTNYPPSNFLLISIIIIIPSSLSLSFDLILLPNTFLTPLIFKEISSWLQSCDLFDFLSFIIPFPFSIAFIRRHMDIVFFFFLGGFPDQFSPSTAHFPGFWLQKQVPICGCSCFVFDDYRVDDSTCLLGYGWIMGFFSIADMVFEETQIG